MVREDSPMQIEYLKKSDYALWNRFVDNSNEGSIFSKSWYLDALHVEYKILSIKKDAQIVSGVVLAKNEIKSYSNPMLDKYLGILFLKEEGNQLKITSKRYKYMELIAKEIKEITSFDYYFHPSFTNWIPLSWQGFTQQTRYTYQIDNRTKSIEEIESGFHLNIRRNIKNSLKHKVIIKENIPFEDLWEVVNKTFLRQGSKSPFRKEKLRLFTQELIKRDAFRSFGAYDKENNCLSVLGIVYENKASYLLLNGINIEKEIRGANAHIIAHSIKYFHKKCNHYDFEGSMLFGIEEFYRKFGGELVPYMRIWNDNFFNYAKTKAKKIYKKMRYGK